MADSTLQFPLPLFHGFFGLSVKVNWKHIEVKWKLTETTGQALRKQCEVEGSAVSSVRIVQRSFFSKVAPQKVQGFLEVHVSNFSGILQESLPVPFQSSIAFNDGEYNLLHLEEDV